ncbi:RecQ family ATP-dependent DNA helicase [Rubrobacter tropicus]|uniref:RecQ family ATP-dependent DNA helicase n=1 Tax=Rubrobacter tropicus TaxID=2653851 RepID=UPI00140DE365|nr:RecQ family ATP-dependent DNA helicase [Rubrobacter tropicus]
MSAPASGSADASNGGAGDLPRRLLLRVFGHEDFRPGQEDIIAAAVAGRDVLAVMPTSGGKSLCYQVPALMGEGLTVVVSPLVSLIKDQIDALRARVEASDEGVPAGAVAALHSSLSVSERRAVERRVLSGEAKILYLAPERLRSLEIVLLLRRAGGGAGVSLVVVDEAHCTSEWGHSFRPEYLFLRTAIRDLGSRGSRPPIMALTATADPRVRGDIVELLGLREPEVIRTGFDRPNLRYRVRWVAEDGRLHTVVRALNEGEAPAIVYAHTRSRCEELASALSSRGIRAEAYHAGMGPAERDAVQGRFMDDELPVIVATVAFGMGVDKPNVRTVVHAKVPDSIPAYVQEAGRAGRDGRPAFSTVLFSPEELEHRKDLARTNLTAPEDAKAFLDALKKIGVPEKAGPNAGKLRANPNPQDLSRLGDVGGGAAADVLRALEAMGRVRRGYNLWAEIRIKRLPPDASSAAPPDDGSAGAGVLRALARRGTGSRVPLVDLAREVGASPAAVQASLTRLIRSGRIEAAPKGRIADLLVKPAPLGRRELADLGARFEHRSEQEARHLEEVAAYASLTTCRRARLLSHFGDEAAELVAPCDGCDVCRKRSVPSLLRRFFGGLADAFAPAGT